VGVELEMSEGENGGRRARWSGGEGEGEGERDGERRVRDRTEGGEVECGRGEGVSTQVCQFPRATIDELLSSRLARLRGIRPLGAGGRDRVALDHKLRRADTGTAHVNTHTMLFRQGPAPSSPWHPRPRTRRDLKSALASARAAGNTGLRGSNSVSGRSPAHWPAGRRPRSAQKEAAARDGIAGACALWHLKGRGQRQLRA